MESADALAQRFRSVILDGTWIANTNFKDQLSQVDWEQANARIASLNTIALLAQHIHYYIEGLNRVFGGGKLDIKDQFSFDFPAIASQETWEAFLGRFWQDAEDFAQWIEQMPNNQLEQVFIDEKYGSYERNIAAMIEHSYYHLGQIVLIRKMLTKL